MENDNKKVILTPDELPTKSRCLRAKSIMKRLETERNKNTPKQRPPRQKHQRMSKYRRKTANAKERDRMRSVNDAFERLKSALPHREEIAQEDKSTKVSTLRFAISYINSLKQLIEDSNNGLLDAEWIRECTLQSELEGEEENKNNISKRKGGKNQTKKNKAKNKKAKKSAKGSRRNKTSREKQRLNKKRYDGGVSKRTKFKTEPLKVQNFQHQIPVVSPNVLNQMLLTSVTPHTSLLPSLSPAPTSSVTVMNNHGSNPMLSKAKLSTPSPILSSKSMAISNSAVHSKIPVVRSDFNASYVNLRLLPSHAFASVTTNTDATAWHDLVTKCHQNNVTTSGSNSVAADSSNSSINSSGSSNSMWGGILDDIEAVLKEEDNFDILLVQ